MTSHARHITVQLATFLVVGSLNTLFAYALFAAFIFIGWHYTLATLAAGVLSVLSGYMAHRQFVFSFRGNSRLFRFALVFAANYLLSIGIQAGLIGVGLNSHYAGGAVATVACAMTSFALNRYYVFR